MFRRHRLIRTDYSYDGAVAISFTYYCVYMTTQSGDRSSYFPAIEKKHGKPIEYWFAQLSKLGEAKYADQLALLREKHGFSQAHANAVVMHHRGSTTSRRHSSVDELLATLSSEHRMLIEKIIDGLVKKFPDLELVVAWNQPMLKYGKDYVIGLSASKNHITIGPWGDGVMEKFAGKLSGLKTNKKTFQVPLDWKVDTGLMNDIVRYRLDELN